MEKQAVKPLIEKVEYVPQSSLSLIHIKDEKNGKTVTHACNSHAFSLQCSVIFCPKKINFPFENDGMRSWVKFMSLCGFPCTLTEDKDKFYIKVLRTEYKNNLHFKAGLTAIRYPFYYYINTLGKEIAKAAVDRYVNNKGTALECLIRANHKVVADRTYSDTSHSLGYCTQVFKKEELFKRIKTNYTVNQLFS